MRIRILAAVLAVLNLLVIQSLLLHLLDHGVKKRENGFLLLAQAIHYVLQNLLQNIISVLI